MRFALQMKRWFAAIVDSGPLVRTSTRITWKFARFLHRERRLTPANPESTRRGVSFNTLESAPNARARTLKAKFEQNPRSGHWSRVSKIAKAIIVELGKNAQSGNYYVYAALPRRTHGMDAGESLIAKRDHIETTSKLVDPYGLITRWKTRTESNLPQ